MNRDAKIKLMAEEGWLPSNIADHLGMSTEVVRRKLREMNVVSATQQQNDMPYGMTDDSYKLRLSLAGIVGNLMEKYKQPAVSSLTGLNRGEISRAMNPPYSHNWTLSQIERTLSCELISLKDIV